MEPIVFLLFVQFPIPSAGFSKDLDTHKLSQRLWRFMTECCIFTYITEDFKEESERVPKLNSF